MNRAADLITVLITALAVAAAHEAMHGVAYLVLGYRVAYGMSVHPFAVYVTAFGQWHKRDHSIVTALLPVVLLTAVGVPMLALPDRTIVLVGLTALMMNASAAVGDLYLVWCLLRLPRATLFYPVDMNTMLVCIPVAGDEEEPT